LFILQRKSLTQGDIKAKANQMNLPIEEEN